MKGEVTKPGKKFYEEHLKPILEPQENGKFVAIEPESQEYFVGTTALEALKKGNSSFPEKKIFFWQESDFRRLINWEAMAVTKESGKVNQQREPCIFVEFENGKNVELLIDTGFNGSLCLPRSLMS